MRGLVLGLLLLACVGSQFGCSGRGRLARMLPTTKTYDDGTDDSSDPWIGEAASEGRSEFEVEREQDPLGLKSFFMSQKARDIERNLGVE